MGRVIKMPVPVGAQVLWTCPEKHGLGWDLHGTDTHEAGTFAKLVCRKCGFEMYAEMVWAIPVLEDFDE